MSVIKKIVFAGVLVQAVFVWKYCESVQCEVTPKNKEARLQQALLCSYDKTIRPTINSKNKTSVRVKMFVKSFDFDDVEGKLTINSWLSMRWTDDHLKWNAKDYDNIQSINIHSEEIWTPDLALYNSKTTQYSETCTASHCIVFYNGVVSCIPPCSHEAYCASDYTYWPFDTQNCSLHLGSWVHKGEEIDYQVLTIGIDKFKIQHKEWKIISTYVKKNLGNYSCCPDETYPSLHYNFLIERHSAAEQAFIIAPAIILAALNLITLWLNPNSSERMLIGVVAIFSHFMFVQQMSWFVPKNGNNVPNAILYFRDSLFIAAILLLNTLVMRALLSCRSSIPGWLKTTVESLKNNKLGNAMLSKPYLINRTPLNNESLGDDANLIEGGGQSESLQPAEETTKSENSTTDMWTMAVRIVDSLMFIILLIIYLLMFIGWLPKKYKTVGRLDAEIIDESE